jgi:hypothetical protein
LVEHLLLKNRPNDLEAYLETQRTPHPKISASALRNLYASLELGLVERDQDAEK